MTIISLQKQFKQFFNPVTLQKMARVQAWWNGVGWYYPSS